MIQRTLLLWLPFLYLFPEVIHAQQPAWNGSQPEVAEALRSVAAKFETYDVVLAPDKDAPEWWAGAPSVVRDEEGVFWLAARMRSPEHPRGLRGYEIRILKSEDGIHFTPVHHIRRQDVPIPGFERPALLIDPETKKFKLYACGPWQEGPWAIIKLADADDPTQFDPASARPVTRARACDNASSFFLNVSVDALTVHLSKLIDLFLEILI